MESVEHSPKFLAQIGITATLLVESSAIDRLAIHLDALRNRQGRLFVIGVGGGAANAAHAVNDFRKLCGIETYAPTDNIAEVTARTNDNGFDLIFCEWLAGSRLGPDDALLVFSVGGGKGLVSQCITRAVNLAKERGAKVLGVVGAEDGATAQLGDCVVVVPLSDEARHRGWLTPITEAFQIVVLHMLVSHPRLQVNETRW